ncbi:hypothetical protein [Pseudomonas aeruginosa]|uniref:hypothetical protein n=1 Tax=Pseudomonas aeruginosa TaxID=287 RepID=UPI00093BDC18|nr:hypothetical protein [Pseudomonas aeruginosa]MBG4607004.1 hypothetical protein [Pseudomonas aeruginosa]MBG5536911.1 hypothetical protein [Pseudomonas aeruginosa]MBG5780323.1 hypothetical protein [Pseudomonas aeruginosa]MBT9112038.1 hypothetical protein [Pseudomonas aeruginosa]MBT9118038.1 hypothetical protein [Pseudomonas aeruginosa]
MDLRYLAWVFKGTLVVTLLYVIACLVIWMLLGSQKGWIALVMSVATWLMFFSIHAKDHRVEQRYYNEHRDRFYEGKRDASTP